MGSPGTVDSVAVHLPWPSLGQVDVPHEIGLLADADPSRFGGAVRLVEQAQLDGFGVFAEDREVYTAAVPGRAERIRLTRMHSNSHKAALQTRADGGANLAQWPRPGWPV